MNERLFARLAQWLAGGPVVLASVLHTRGATPRKRGAHMLITPENTDFSIAGGLSEARVIAAARELLSREGRHSELQADLTGHADAIGVCGGHMRIALRRWCGAPDQARAADLAACLAAGRRIDLDADDLGSANASERVQPNPRLLIVGAGHCGRALYDLARHLDFDIWVFDPRPSCFGAGRFSDATCRGGDYAALADALATERVIHAVLLNAGFQADIETLRELARRPPAFVSMMGSRRRIGMVLAALPEQRTTLAHLNAPVGLDIGAQTPHEIAVSILAQVIRDRQCEHA